MDQASWMKRLQQNPQAAQRALQSPDGQALWQMLSGGDGGAALQQAMAQANGGNTAPLAAMLRQVMQSPQGAALIGNIGKELTK